MEISTGEVAGQPISPIFFRHYSPKGRLANFVGIFWYWQGQDLLKGKEQALPSPGVELVINLTSHRPSYSVISGPRSKSFLIGGSQETSLLGIHFRPGGIFPFLPFPVSELHNIDIGLDALWGKEKATYLLEQLQSVESVDVRFKILERWLLANLLHPLKHHLAIDLALTMLQRKPNLSTAELAENANLSQRRFIQVFQNELGFTPKMFSRLQRFQRALDVIGMNTDIDWLDVAFLCGYFDQAHFNHDFREFSGITPSQYLRLRTEHKGHLPAPN